MKELRPDSPFVTGLTHLDDAWEACGQPLRGRRLCREELNRCNQALGELRTVIESRNIPDCGKVLDEIEDNLVMLREGVIDPNPNLLDMISDSIGLLRSILLNETPEAPHTGRRRIAAAAAAAHKTVSSAPGALRILIADPSQIDRRLLGGLLQPLGACDQAEDGPSALKLVRAAIAHNAPYRLICLNPVLHGLDGLEIVRQLRLLERAVVLPRSKRAAVVVIPSPDDTTDLRSSQLYQVSDGRLYKPVSKGRLTDELRRLHLIG